MSEASEFGIPNKKSIKFQLKNSMQGLSTGREESFHWMDFIEGNFSEGEDFFLRGNFLGVIFSGELVS